MSGDSQVGEEANLTKSSITKSQRHSKIIGVCGEALIANWLSRSGFEVMFVDHVGIDLIASHPTLGRMGISVKSRTRGKAGSETTHVTLFRQNSDKDGIKELRDVCEQFGLQPWVAIYVECRNSADIYVTSLDNYLARHAGAQTNSIYGWKMREVSKAAYREDEQVMHVAITFATANWPAITPLPEQ